MSGAGGVGRINPLEDRRMWRLLLARLHPDAGGDHELFLFASALRERACNDKPLEELPERSDGETGAERVAEPFLQAWQDKMDCWASHNRETLRGLVLAEMPLASTRH